ncbi:hypothetical protein RJ40_08915 [Methanofollis aquaemaris]|uniref:Uncharacterized protein n=1 Tax=Methanofollis aquaemaris TaxID=126734 RepID=A0A8A3S639_9EURY|nr:hypothetical protein [Methanofollis aquaemaris]QSZ67618.1 hypothetical protein RJ40_08915 [Methanofollis aquaemaris]
MTVDLQGIPDGASFSLRIDAAFAVDPGSKFVFRTEEFVMPISLKDSTITASTEHTRSTTLEVKTSGATYSMGDLADEDGRYSTTQHYNISAGTYEHLALSGTAGEKSTDIRTSMSLTGEKKGPDDSEISFKIGGITDGSVTITALVNGNEELSREITIGGGVTPTQPSNPGIPSGHSNVGERVTKTPTPEQRSVDGVVRVTGKATDCISVLNVKVAEVPEGWQAITGAYTLTPQEKTFSPEASLIFRLPKNIAAEPEAYTLFLARYAEGTWKPLPSSINGEEISATITTTGTYALMTYAPVTATVTTAATVQSQANTHEETASLTTPTTTATPTQTPAGILPAIGAVVGILSIAGARKRW